jgi:hypothetical protein
VERRQAVHVTQVTRGGVARMWGCDGLFDSKDCQKIIHKK